jgi:phenylalanyl-tRNA synthetase alpha chain
MLDKISKITAQFEQELKEAGPDTLAELKNKYLGKDSELLSILKGIKNVADIEEKKQIGQAANTFRESVTKKIEAEIEKIANKQLKARLESEVVDSTRPGSRSSRSTTKAGKLHVITQTIREIEDIFLSLGFKVEYSYDIDNAFNTFDALNIPASHPARDSWDTLWLSDGNLAIPQTSAMQNRIISRAQELPLKSIVIGRTFRNEATDARHEHTFMQVEGVYLDRTANMSEMLGVLLEFFEKYFGKKLAHKFSPDFFPFVEPGGQLAIECVICAKKGCRLCKYSGFLEILGCGMIHPKVLKEAGKEENFASGFAWGFGLERIVLIKEAIDDIRYFHSGDLRFINQF